MLCEVTAEEVEMWEMREKVREGKWWKTLQAEVGLVCLCRIQLMAAAQLPCIGRLGSEGHSEREGEVERRYSRKESVPPKKNWDWASADETGCFPPNERSPETNPPCPPLLLPPPSSLPDPPCCHQQAQQAQGGSLCYASSGTDQGSAWALSSVEACPLSRQFYLDMKGSPLCSHRIGHSPGPHTQNHKPVPERSESFPESVQLSCCENICVGRPV